MYCQVLARFLRRQVISILRAARSTDGSTSLRSNASDVTFTIDKLTSLLAHLGALKQLTLDLNSRSVQQSVDDVRDLVFEISQKQPLIASTRRPSAVIFRHITFCSHCRRVLVCYCKLLRVIARPSESYGRLATLGWLHNRKKWRVTARAVVVYILQL